MNFRWEVSESDISKVTDFVTKHESPYVENIIKRNINHKDLIIDRDFLLKTMLRCLLSSETELYPEDKIDAMLNEKPFILTYKYLFKVSNIEYALRETLIKFGITRNINKVPKFFSGNFDFLEETEWDLEQEIVKLLSHDLTKHEERDLADRVDQGFKGFGSKEARSFLLLAGVSKYEIPIDSQFISWLENFPFPVRFSKTALQDKMFYHFVSDGIQLLCEKAGIFPCVLYAALVSGSGTRTR